MIEISADVEAVYGCRNRGGKFPSGLALQRVAEDTVSNSTTLELHDNLKAQVTLTLATPELPESLGCPPPLEPGLKEVTYSNITGTITTEKVRYVPFSVVPEELSATF